MAIENEDETILEEVIEKKEPQNSTGKLIFLPEGAKAIAEIPIEFIEGNFKDRLDQIIQGATGLMEVSDQEYEVLRELLPMIEIDFKILVGTPNVNSPRSFLAEQVQERIMSYHNLKFTPEKEEDRFVQKLKEARESSDSDQDVDLDD